MSWLAVFLSARTVSFPLQGWKFPGPGTTPLASPPAPLGPGDPQWRVVLGPWQDLQPGPAAQAALAVGPGPAPSGVRNSCSCHGDGGLEGRGTHAHCSQLGAERWAPVTSLRSPVLPPFTWLPSLCVHLSPLPSIYFRFFLLPATTGPSIPSHRTLSTSAPEPHPYFIPSGSMLCFLPLYDYYYVP